MRDARKPIGRRERAKQDKRERIMAAARELFAERGVGGVTTQQVAERADVAIGTLYLYAATKAELLIMVQNQKFAVAIDAGQAAAAAAGQGPLDGVIALIRPVVACVREQVENGRTYLHELVFGDPSEPYRREGLVLSARLEDGIAQLLTRDERIDGRDAATLARVITAIIHISTTATVYLHRSDETVLRDIREQVRVTMSLDRILPLSNPADNGIFTVHENGRPPEPAHRV
ncbi:TetR/AcrR family transcriptional regulator [Knoellia sp. S7-12]|uniref:TetR/AcrR family transcriptional regulator n=1 Tax=Knoellia sp. S7-12 TaxID=3126698 RepID=UPI003367C8B5